MATERTHEFLLSGRTDTANRLGFRYTEGDNFATLLVPDSEYGEQSAKISFEDTTELARFLADVLPVFEGTMRSDG